jgi:hypothetical protein
MSYTSDVQVRQDALTSRAEGTRTLDLQEKAIRQASTMLVDCPPGFHPLTTAHPDHDAGQ